MNKPDKVYYEKPDSYHKKRTHQNKIQISFSWKKPDSDKGIKELVLNGILVVLSIAFVFLLIGAVEETGYYQYDYTKDEDDFWYSIQEGNYPQLVTDVYHNQNAGVELTPGLEQCYAVARYFEAASLYKIAVQMENQADMEKYSTVMEENLVYMDDISYIAEDINKELGIE